MPTKNRRGFVRKKTMVEFRENINEMDHEKVKFLLSLGETNLDDVISQAGHLGDISKREGYHKV